MDSKLLNTVLSWLQVQKENDNLTAGVNNINLDEKQEILREPSPVVVRRKEKQTKLTDEEVFTEMKYLCNPADPYKKFNLSKELGSGFVYI